MSTYTESKLINSYELSNQLNPTISTLSNGNFLVSWFSWYQDGSNYGVYGQIITPELEFVGAEFQLNEYTTGNQYHQTIVPLESGGFYGLWYSSQYAGLNLREFDSLGNPIGPETHTGIKNYKNIPVELANENSLVSSSNSAIPIAWTDRDNTIGFGTVDLSSSTFEQFYTSGSTSSLSSSSPHSVQLDNGNFVIGFSQYMADGSDYSAQMVLLDENGLVIESQTTVNSSFVGNQYVVDVIQLNTDEFGVVWSNEGKNSVLSIYDAYAGTLEEEVEISNTSDIRIIGVDRNSILDAILTEPNVVSFLKADGSLVHYNRVTNEQRLDTPSQNTVQFVSDSILTDKSTMFVTWSADAADVDGYGILATNLSLSPPSHIVTTSVVTRDGSTISDVDVVMSDGTNGFSYKSEADGSVSGSLTSGSASTIEASLAYSSSIKAISSQDALDALKLSVGMTTAAGTTNVFDFISADFNQDGKVSSQDALAILKYSVGLPTTEQAKWVFVDTNGDYSGVSKSNTSYTEGVSIADLSADTTVSLTGILIGDVNDSYSGLIA